jgi:hypothetical protein
MTIGVHFPELHVFASNLGCPGWMIARWQSVFSNAEQKEEHNHYQVGSPPVFGINRRPFLPHDVLEHRYGKCELWMRSGVLVLVASMV